MDHEISILATGRVLQLPRGSSTSTGRVRLYSHWLHLTVRHCRDIVNCCRNSVRNCPRAEPRSPPVVAGFIQ